MAILYSLLCECVMESYSGRLECLRFLRLPNTTVFADKISATRSCRSTCAVARHARTVHHNSGRPKAASRIGRRDLGSTDRAALRNDPEVSNLPRHSDSGDTDPRCSGEHAPRNMLAAGVWVEFFDVEAAFEA